MIHWATTLIRPSADTRGGGPWQVAVSDKCIRAINVELLIYQTDFSRPLKQVLRRRSGHAIYAVQVADWMLTFGDNIECWATASIFSPNSIFTRSMENCLHIGYLYVILLLVQVA